MRLRALLALTLACAACSGQIERDPPYPPYPTSGCPPSHEPVNGRCTVREVFIPGGQFVLGAGYCSIPRILETPPVVGDCPLADAPRTVTVKPFWVDVTARAFSDSPAFYREDCPTADVTCAGRGYEPLTLPFIDSEFEPAAAVALVEEICQQRGRRWLTEVEWEYLATGGGTRRYPWGDREPKCSDGNFDFERCGARNAEPDGGVSLVASYSPSPEGVYDLFGGSWEMLAPSPQAYDNAYTPVPLSLSEDCAVPCDWIPGAPITAARGASPATPIGDVRADYRYPSYGRGSGFFKFRCARDAD